MEADLKETARLYASGSWQAALDSLVSVDSTDENHLDIAYFLGLSHARLGHWEEAMLFLEQVVTASEDFMRVCQCRLALAYAYAMTDRCRLAEYELDRLVQTGFRSAQVFSALGHTAWMQGKTDSAIEWYSSALEMDPESPNALNGLGYVLASLGRDTARALTCCRKAVDYSPGNPAYLDSLGWAYHRLGYDNEACDYISQALRLAPGENEIREHAAALEMDLPSLNKDMEL